MTRKLTFSLPDDIAERLDREDNVSAYVAEAIRRRMAAETPPGMLEAAGFAISDEGVRAMGEELAAARRGISPELREKAAALRAEVNRARR